MLFAYTTPNGVLCVQIVSHVSNSGTYGGKLELQLPEVLTCDTIGTHSTAFGVV